MSKLSLPGSVWIASDIHLGPHCPATVQAFHRFLTAASLQADALLLCGDIFESWIGDDLALKDPPIWLLLTIDRLRNVSERIPLWLGRGNRDFLMGPVLARHVNALLLPEPAVINTDAGMILLSHGDEYCTHDPGYQRFRRIVRNRSVQDFFLDLSLGTRQRIANWARERSKRANRNKTKAILDVHPKAIEQAFSQYGVSTLIHGHTHRPGAYRVRVEGSVRTRYVLPDWDYDHDKARGGWLEISRQGITLRDWRPAELESSPPKSTASGKKPHSQQ